MDITEYLRTLASEDGSDLYLSTGAPISGKFQGELRPPGRAGDGGGRSRRGG